MTCQVCGTEMRPKRSDLPGRAHCGHGLCQVCYNRRRRDATRTRPYRQHRPRADAVEDYLFLLGSGESDFGRIARRMRYKPVTLETVLRRAGVTGIPDYRRGAR